MKFASAFRFAALALAPAAIALLLALPASPAVGQVLFDGSFPAGAADDVGFNDPDAGGQRLAEDFQIAATATMTGVSFMGGYYPTNTPTGVDNFTLTIFGDAAGLPDPGNIIAQFPIAVDVTDTGVFSVGVHMFVYTAQFAGVELQGNTPYWFLIVNDTTNDTNDDWVWAGRHGEGIFARSFDHGQTWIDTQPGAFSFQILGEGPTATESSSWGRVKSLYR